MSSTRRGSAPPTRSRRSLTARTPRDSRPLRWACFSPAIRASRAASGRPTTTTSRRASASPSIRSATARPPFARGYGIFYAIGFTNMAMDMQGQPFLVDVTVFGTPNLVDPYANVPGGSPFPYKLDAQEPGLRAAHHRQLPGPEHRHALRAAIQLHHRAAVPAGTWPCIGRVCGKYVAQADDAERRQRARLHPRRSPLRPTSTPAGPTCPAPTRRSRTQRRRPTRITIRCRPPSISGSRMASRFWRTTR